MKRITNHTVRRGKRRLLILTAAVLLLAMLPGCHFTSSKSYTFSVETGDSIKVTLDTSDGYALSQENGMFSVSSGEETILQGIFLLEETYEQYMELSETADGIIVLEEDERKDVSYLFYEFVGEAGTENDFVIFVKDSGTGVLIGSLAGRDAAKAAFDRLTFSCE